MRRECIVVVLSLMMLQAPRTAGSPPPNVPLCPFEDQIVVVDRAALTELSERQLQVCAVSSTDLNVVDVRYDAQNESVLVHVGTPGTYEMQIQECGSSNVENCRMYAGVLSEEYFFDVRFRDGYSLSELSALRQIPDYAAEASGWLQGQFILTNPPVASSSEWEGGLGIVDDDQVRVVYRVIIGGLFPPGDVEWKRTTELQYLRDNLEPVLRRSTSNDLSIEAADRFADLKSPLGKYDGDNDWKGGDDGKTRFLASVIVLPLVSVGLIAVGVFFLWRRHHTRKKRLSAEQQSNDVQESNPPATVPQFGSLAVDVETGPTNQSPTPELEMQSLTRKDLSATTPLENELLPDNIRWQRGELLGRGAFGSVYLALNMTAGGKLMAVKEIVSTGSAEEVGALMREVDILKQIKHPNVVRYLGIEKNESAGVINIFLEYVSGGSLLLMLEQYGKFDDNVAANYTHQALLGLEYLHTSGIVHRDIKPGNLLVTNDGVVKLADFGCSKVVAGSTTGQSLTLQGTPFYMAPEVIMNKRSGRSSDIWSLGTTVLQILTGNQPWHHKCFTNPMVAMFHIGTGGGIPEWDHDQVSEQASEFLLKCFVREPKDRPSATDLRKLDWFLRFSQDSETKDMAPAPIVCANQPSSTAVSAREAIGKAADESIQQNIGSVYVGDLAQDPQLLAAGLVLPSRPPSWHDPAHDPQMLAALGSELQSVTSGPAPSGTESPNNDGMFGTLDLDGRV